METPYTASLEIKKYVEYDILTQRNTDHQHDRKIGKMDEGIFQDTFSLQ